MTFFPLLIEEFYFRHTADVLGESVNKLVGDYLGKDDIDGELKNFGVDDSADLLNLVTALEEPTRQATAPKVPTPQSAPTKPVSAPKKNEDSLSKKKKKKKRQGLPISASFHQISKRRSNYFLRSGRRAQIPTSFHRATAIGQRRVIPIRRKIQQGKCRQNSSTHGKPRNKVFSLFFCDKRDERYFDVKFGREF